MRSSFVSTFIIFKDIKVVRVAIVADVQILSFPKILRLQGLFKLYHFKIYQGCKDWRGNFIYKILNLLFPAKIQQDSHLWCTINTVN